MRAVHVCIGHDDNLVVTKLGEIESAFAVPIANSGADGRNHRPDFIVLKHLVQARFFHVNQLAPNRQNGLKLAITSLLGRAARRITLHNVQLRICRVAVGAIR